MDTRDKIMISALELFKEKGYPLTSIQDIGERAGVSKGAVFHYFPNKSDLLFALHEKMADFQLEQLEKILLKDDLSPTEKLCQLMIYHVQGYADNKPGVVVFYQEFRYVTEDKLKVIKEKRDTYEEIFRKVVRQGVESGDFRQDLDVNIITKAIFGMCSWTYQWLNPEGPIAPAQIGEIFCKLLIDGLRKKD